MKSVLLTGLVALALVFSACNREAGINGPNSTGSNTTFMKAADQLNLSNEQMAFADEMIYLNEDMSIILNPAQMTALNSIMGGDPSISPRGFVDMAAVMYYNLILKANPDMSQETKDAIKLLIDESTKNRQQIVADNKGADPKAIQELLKAEHDRLMEEINKLLTEDQLTAIEVLKAKIEADRQAQRDKWTEIRITQQIKFLTQLLTLEQGQQDAIKEILKLQDKAIQDLRLQYKGNPEGFKAALKELQKATEAKIVALLTPAQVEIWNKWKTGKLDPRGGGGKKDPIQMEVDKWTNALKLDAAQQAQLKDILTKRDAAIKQAKLDNKENPRGANDAILKIQKETDARIVSILTPEQLKIWNKMHGIGDGGGTGGDPIQAQIDMYNKILGLDQVQVGILKQILIDKNGTQIQIMEKYRSDPITMKEMLLQLDKDTDARILKELNLTAVQLEAWTKWKSGSTGGKVGG